MQSQTSSTPFLLERRPSIFLPLAPTTSASYPTLPKSPTQSQESAPVEQRDAQVEASQATATIAPAVAGAGDVAEHLKTRRSSSSASDVSSKRGYLKLGPVHFGETDGDWSEDVIAA